MEKVEGQLNRIENNLGTIVDLLQTFIGRVKKLEQKEAEHDATLKDVRVGRAKEAEPIATSRDASPERSPKGSVHGDNDSDSSDDDDGEGGASSAPESRQTPVGPSAARLSPPVKVQADRRRKKAGTTAPRSPPTTAPAFFSGEETEEEVALSKVPTPKK